MSDLVITTELLDDGTGTEFEGWLYQCRCSNIDEGADGPHLNSNFVPFYDPRHEPPHFHHQCSDCGQTYCFSNMCVPPPTVT